MIYIKLSIENSYCMIRTVISDYSGRASVLLPAERKQNWLNIPVLYKFYIKVDMFVIYRNISQKSQCLIEFEPDLKGYPIVL